MKELTKCQQCNHVFNFPKTCKIIPSKYGVIITCDNCFA